MVQRARTSIGSQGSSIEEFAFDQPVEAVAVDEKDVYGIGEADFTRPLEPRTFPTDFSAMV